MEAYSMGPLSKAAIAAYIVLSGLCQATTTAGIDDGFSSEPTVPYEITVRTEIKHPASRKTVAGPWPRFAKEMLA